MTNLYPYTPTYQGKPIADPVMHPADAVRIAIKHYAALTDGTTRDYDILRGDTSLFDFPGISDDEMTASEMFLAQLGEPRSSLTKLPPVALYPLKLTDPIPSLLLRYAHQRSCVVSTHSRAMLLAWSAGDAVVYHTPKDAPPVIEYRQVELSVDDLYNECNNLAHYIATNLPIILLVSATNLPRMTKYLESVDIKTTPIVYDIERYDPAQVALHTVIVDQYDYDLLRATNALDHAYEIKIASPPPTPEDSWQLISARIGCRRQYNGY
jgi:hypothetical protein